VAIGLGLMLFGLQQLIGEKEVFRDLEARATEAHFVRIRAGQVESVETSALHLDVLRNLKRINAHIAATAYAVLKNAANYCRAACGRMPGWRGLAVVSTDAPARPT
jgi:hypothetical protein